jgi:hypothetical protein
MKQRAAHRKQQREEALAAAKSSARSGVVGV